MNTPLDPADADGCQIFGTSEDAAALAHPLGLARALRHFKSDPDAPRPVFGGGKAGSKEIYYLPAMRLYWHRVGQRGSGVAAAVAREAA